MTSYFSVPRDSDWDAMRKLAEERAYQYRGMPGMRSKAFIVDPEGGLYGANYVWDSRDAIDDFLKSELFRGIVQRLGEPEVHIFEVPAYLEQGEIVYLASGAALPAAAGAAESVETADESATR
ncbi:MAG: DUF4865 family protein [Pseudonocardiaceae bacterium]